VKDKVLQERLTDTHKQVIGRSEVRKGEERGGEEWRGIERSREERKGDHRKGEERRGHLASLGRRQGDRDWSQRECISFALHCSCPLSCQP
jgi:hypothetical protein